MIFLVESLYNLCIAIVCFTAKYLPAKIKPAGFAILCLFSNLLAAQQNKQVNLDFKPGFGEQVFLLDSTYTFENETIRFESLKFYVSNIELLKNNKTVWKEKNSFHLYDASNLNTAIKLEVPSKISFDKVKFVLGIDSVTNVSGAMGGDLDPTKGMYWTWQSGYINFKLEGTSSLCKNSRKDFQLHLGGYQNPFSCAQTFFLNTGTVENVILNFDVKKFISIADLKNKDHIMSPSEDAVKLSEVIFQCISIN